MIDVAVKNASGEPVLFTGAASNSLVVSLTNAGAGSLALSAGAVVAESQAGGAAATLVFVSVDLGDGLSDPQAAGLRVSCPGWSVAQFLEGWWSLAPSAGGELEKAKSVEVRIEGWPSFATAAAGQVHVEYYRFGEETGFSDKPLFVHAAPSGRPLPIRFGFGLDPTGTTLTDEVYVSGGAIENTLLFAITNTDKDAAIPGAAAGAGAAPLFQLCVPAGRDASAATLTTSDRAKVASPSPPHGGSAAWDLHYDDQGLPCWSLAPTGDPLLKSGESVTFGLTGLVVPEPIGEAYVYLQHSAVPGFDDGYLPLLVPKVRPKPGILQFVLLSSPVPPVGDRVRLSWSTFAVPKDGVELAYRGEKGPRTITSPAISASERDFTVPDPIGDDDTTYTLTAPKVPGAQAQRTVTPYSTELEVSDPTVKPGGIGGNESVTVRFRAQNAASVVLTVDGGVGSVPIDVGEDGHVTFVASVGDNNYLLDVSQGGVAKGAPLDIHDLVDNRAQSITLRAEVRGTDGAVAHTTAGVTLLPASITEFELYLKDVDGVRRPYARWRTEHAAAAVLTYAGAEVVTDGLSGDVELDPTDEGDYTLFAHAFGPQVWVTKRAPW